MPRVYADGMTADGCPYFVMDLLAGETVETRRLRFGGRLAWAEVVRIALVVLDVLDTVHRRGLLHRDVKPSNVLWLDDGTIRLIDFGIAKAAASEDALALTRTGTLPGSLAFMSPEHALGVPSAIDERSDLWSLGATMFLLLSGRPVHESQTEVGALALSASREARSLGAVVTGLPPALVMVVDRALMFDRRKRYADAAEMRAALEDLSAERMHLPRVRRWTFVLAGLALAGGGILATWPARPSVEAPRPAPSGAPGGSVEAAPPPATATATATAEIETPPSAEAARPLRSARKPVPSAAPSSTPRCDPPYFIDPATGTRRVKPGC